MSVLAVTEDSSKNMYIIDCSAALLLGSFNQHLYPMVNKLSVQGQ